MVGKVGVGEKEVDRIEDALGRVEADSFSGGDLEDILEAGEAANVIEVAVAHENVKRSGADEVEHTEKPGARVKDNGKIGNYIARGVGGLRRVKSACSETNNSHGSATFRARQKVVIF
jgi:hypothetical protein